MILGGYDEVSEQMFDWPPAAIMRLMRKLKKLFYFCCFFLNGQKTKEVAIYGPGGFLQPQHSDLNVQFVSHTKFCSVAFRATDIVWLAQSDSGMAQQHQFSHLGLNQARSSSVICRQTRQ